MKQLIFIRSKLTHAANVYKAHYQNEYNL